MAVRQAKMYFDRGRCGNKQGNNHQGDFWKGRMHGLILLKNSRIAVQIFGNIAGKYDMI